MTTLNTLQQHQSNINWNVLKAQAPEGTEADDEDTFQFVDERTMKYTDMLENDALQNTKIDNVTIDNDDNSTGAAILEADDDDSVVFGGNDEIDIDDI